MQIRLPSAAEVTNAIEIWSAGDSRLAVLLKRYPETSAALRHYGLVLWDGGQLQSASQILTGAAALEPDDALIWSDLAGVFNALGHRNEALACAEESVARGPLQARTWLQLGTIQNTAGYGLKSVHAFQRALDLDTNLVDAWIGLGLAYLETKRFLEAAAQFREASRRGKANDPTVQSCLGQALYSAGDFKAAADTFEIACGLQPDNHDLIFKRVRAQFLVDVIQGTAADAVAACKRHPLSDEEFEKTVHDGFHLLSAYGHTAAAIDLGAFRLARAPDDATQAYLLASLKGEAMSRAPNRYIVNFFDRFADDFDRKLIDVLGYKVPRELVGLAEDHARATGLTIARVLDLGCGTGLVGTALTRDDRIIKGVDLSPRMLDKARLLGCYESLIEADVETYLAANIERYDLIVAADLLIYFGDLAPIFSGAANALARGGILALSTETSEDKDIDHLPSGRFAHSAAYIERLAAAAGFTIIDVRHTTIRLEANEKAAGALLLLSRT